MALPLEGRRILVPPSRLGLNPLIHMIERQGAEAVVFPGLEPAPVDPGPLDDALASLPDFGWLVVVGEASAAHLLARLERSGRPLEALPRSIAAIGHGAVTVLRKAGREPDLKPRDHFAEGVADALGAVDGARILLLREAGATADLPAALAARGASVTAITGHAVRALATRQEAEAALARPLDAVAFANPATVRLFSAALRSVGLLPERCLEGVLVAVVGPATAEAARALGIAPDVVAGGRLKRLQESLLERLGTEASPGERPPG